MYFRLCLISIVISFAGLFTQSAHASQIAWAQWNSATFDQVHGSAQANIFTGTQTIDVNLTGEVFPSSSLNGNSNYWTPSSTYTSSEVANAPSWGGRIDQTGGNNNVNKLVFSTAVLDPVLAIVSLGQYGIPASFVFNNPFTLLKQGPGLFGGTDTSLTQPAANILYGVEGSGIIQFKGSFTELDWTNPLLEYGYGFTVGVAAVPEPGFLSMMLLAFSWIGYVVRRQQPHLH